MEDVEIGELGLSGAIAAFLVPVVSAIKKPYWSRQAKFALGMAAALVAALVGAFATGGVESPGGIAVRLTVAFSVANTLYSLYFKDTELNATLEAKGA